MKKNQLQPDKCEFLRKEVGYLGHIISDQGVKPDPAKIQAVKEFPTPRNAKNIKQIIVKEALRSLLDVVTELGLQSISIAKGNVDNVPWEVIHSLLTRILDKTNLKIFTCSNKITIPPNEDRLRILEENHCSAIGGHKGITKTFNRVKKRYNWAGMKADIQSFIRNCRSCQLKKLVRVKTKQPMVRSGCIYERIHMYIWSSESYSYGPGFTLS
ncbi:hypothetical protein ACFW04_012794 [Cataglyphis niger]